MPKKACVLPFPNDYAQTKRDAKTPTGRRVAFTRSSMPANTSGSKVNPREWNRNDGFSPGQPIMVHLPFLTTQSKFRRSGIVPVNDLAKYRSRRQPLLLLDERTGRRQIVWGELDAAEGVPAASRHLVIHPAKNLVPGRRYVVVLRNLKRHAPRGLWRTTSIEAAQGAPQGQGEALERVPRMGLHGGQRQVAHRAAAEDPRRRVRAAGGPQP